LTCAGCGKPPTFSGENIFTSLGVVNHCCNSGRLFGIFLLLSRYDEAQVIQVAPSPKKGSPYLNSPPEDGGHIISCPFCKR
jgi:baculoviral IAP repeat-containing protein 6